MAELGGVASIIHYIHRPSCFQFIKKGWGEHLEPTKTNLIVVPPFPNYLRSKKSRYIFAAMAIL